jgi:hypothetical protein
VRKLGPSLRKFLLLSTTFFVTGQAFAGSLLSDLLCAQEHLAKSPTIVIGFVGGFVRHDDFVHSGVQLAARLRHDYPSGVYAQVFENRHGDLAYQQVLKLLDTDHDGTLSNEEKLDARIVIYGISWGGSQTVTLARELAADKIPVLLTIQVDSIAKEGQNDKTIPPNVAEAVNFYQPDGLLHGEPVIQAEDPARTRILGNYRSEYASIPYNCKDYPWYDRWLLTREHTQIECDPAVWGQVESLIRSKLPPINSASSIQKQNH